jgi:hypothetical protein
MNLRLRPILASLLALGCSSAGGGGSARDAASMGASDDAAMSPLPDAPADSSRFLPDGGLAADSPALAGDANFMNGDGAGEGPAGQSECPAGAPSATAAAMAACATEGELGYVRDGNMPYVCARGPANAQKPSCLLWRRGVWYLQTRNQTWDRAHVDLGLPCTMEGQHSGFPSGTFICSVEPNTKTLAWALSAGDDLLPYVRWDATETSLPHACKPPLDTSNGSQFYRATVDIDPTDSNTLYLNIEWIGPFRSKDGGVTWTPFNINGRALPARKVTGAACHGEYPGFAVDSKDPQHIYFVAGGAPGSELTTPLFQGGGLWESSDGGARFSWLGLPELNQYVAAFVRLDDRKTLLWGTTSSLGTATGPKPPTPQKTGLIYKSLDNGATWHELPTGLWPESTASMLWVDPQNPAHYVMGVFQYLQRLDASADRAPGLMESTDSGATWTALPGQPAGQRAVTGMNTVISRDGKMIYSCGYEVSPTHPGCFRAENGGAFAAAELLAAVAMDPLDASSQRLVGFRLPGGTPTIPIPAAIMASPDGGKTWSSIAPIPTEHPEQIKWDPTVKDRLYLTGEAGAIYRSNDAGVHWTQLTTYTDFINVVRTD